MRITTTILAACLCVALVHSVPINSGFQSQALDRLMVDETVNDEALRSKRTIGILRQLFPEVSKMIEDKLNRIVGEIVKIFGPVVFSSILGNNNKNNAAGGSSKSSGSTVNAEPPFDDDDDDVKSFVDDDDWFNAPAQSDNAGSKISLDLPTLAPKASSTSTSTTTTEAPLLDIGSESSTKPEEANAINVDEVTTPIDETATNSDVNPEASETNQVVSEVDNQAESQNNEVRVQFADEKPSENEGELAPLDDISVSDDENRNKRFLNFGFGASAGNGANGGGGSGGGSGNFLFDIIRQAADSAARAAGTVYRVVAGTQSLGLGLSASRDIGPAPSPMLGGAPAAGAGAPMMPGQQAPSQGPQAPGAAAMPAGTNGTAMMPPLVAGSGSSSSDPGADAPTPGPQTEAVPGPVTRLFVIANRGISNLIQDLILRLAATSERIVNFKARLITSII